MNVKGGLVISLEVKDVCGNLNEIILDEGKYMSRQGQHLEIMDHLQKIMEYIKLDRSIKLTIS